MNTNLEMCMDRGENLDCLMEKSADLKMSAVSFQKKAKTKKSITSKISEAFKSFKGFGRSSAKKEITAEDLNHFESQVSLSSEVFR